MNYIQLLGNLDTYYSGIKIYISAFILSRHLIIILQSIVYRVWQSCDNVHQCHQPSFQAITPPSNTPPNVIRPSLSLIVDASLLMPMTSSHSSLMLFLAMEISHVLHSSIISSIYTLVQHLCQLRNGIYQKLL